eukprot:3933142-Rhodomonas_salina.1
MTCNAVLMCCNKPTCPDYYATGDLTDPFYDGVPEHCVLRQGAPASVRQPRSSNEANLCTKTPEVPVYCEHRQATLGGNGVAIDGSPVEDLYEEVDASTLQDVLGLLPSKVATRNRLFEGKTADEAVYSRVTPLQLSGSDIGGHNIHVRVDSSGAFRVHALPLGETMSEGGDQRWLEVIENVMTREHLATADMRE